MSGTSTESDAQKVARLEAELGRLRRMNDALMARVERGLATSTSGSAFGVFERALVLEDAVAQRTRDLAAAKELAEAQARTLKQQAAELDLARRAAEAAERAKSEFLANMSHEIRTPMTAILGFAETLLDPSLSEADRAETISTIRRNGELLLQIINDVLDLSKIEAGRLETEQVTCSPRAIVADVLSLMRIRTEAKGLYLNLDCPEPVPEQIRTDPIRLKQILINLIGNATKFTQNGGVTVSVRPVGAESGNPILQFEVTDTGIGISPELAGRLFKPFTQADASTARRFGGTGLGLTISKHLAQILGGDLTLESEPDKGSIFRLTIATGRLDAQPLTAHPGNDWAAKPSPTPCLAAADDEPLAGRILLAEDGLDNQRLISFILRKAGVQVDIAENGQIAVDKATAGAPYDLILMDMQMPLIDGYKATAMLRQRGYTGPIIALTAHAMSGDRELCLQAGCDDYASKPIDRRALIATIRARLHRKSPARPEAKAPSLATG